MAASPSPPPVILDAAPATFKYVLIRRDGPNGPEFFVRGHEWAGFHDDLYQHYRPSLASGGAVTCVGGGRIALTAGDGGCVAARIYGHSIGYPWAGGFSQHSVSAGLVAAHFGATTSVTWDDEGY